MTENSLLAAASFVPLSLREPGAWVGHLPFAAWIIRTASPAVCVELGTHSGNSYFAFCQAIKESGVQCKSYAVDTWAGDEHSGSYEEDVFDYVNACNQQHFSAFSTLLRTTFDDAAHFFADASVNLLHIDGLHTYDAVRHDFETWLPKLAPGAVVLFHDTNVHERGFGVWKLWEELKKTYPLHIEFLHSHGLGVIQIEGAEPGREMPWSKFSLEEKDRFTSYFSILGQRQLEHFELLAARRSILALDQQLAAVNENANAQITYRDALAAELRSQLGAVNENANAQIAYRDALINELKAQLEAVNQNGNAQIAYRDALINELTCKLDEVNERMNRVTQEVNLQKEQIETMRKLLSSRKAMLGHVFTKSLKRREINEV